VIIGKLNLIRDDTVSLHNAFGYIDRQKFPILPDGRYISPYAGIRIEYSDGHPRCFPTIIKFIEEHSVCNQLCYIERLCYYHDKELYPYRVKYITTDHQYDETLIIPKNLSMIHNNIQNYPFDLYTPIDFFNRYMRSDSRSELEPHRRSIYQAYGNESVLGNLCHDDDNWIMTLNETIASYHPDALSSYGTIEQCKHVESLIEASLLPALPFTDVLTEKTIGVSLPTRELQYFSKNGSIIYLEQPNPLVIKKPESTLFSPKEFNFIVNLIKDLVYTDLEIEYILQIDRVVAMHKNIFTHKINHVKTNLAYNRYQIVMQDDAAIQVDYTNELARCNRIVSLFIDILKDITRDDQSSIFINDLRVVFRKTFNDEALFEVYLKNGPMIKAVHLDTAMLSLCSMGMAYFFID
jgi:hypothetical protein